MNDRDSREHEDDGSARRRRRRVATRAEGAPTPTPTTPASAPTSNLASSPRSDPGRAKTKTKRAPDRATGGRRGRDNDRDGGLRDLTGAGPSKVGVGGAMRARDINRPSADDLAQADRDIVIIRRQWKPDTTH